MRADATSPALLHHAQVDQRLERPEQLALARRGRLRDDARHHPSPGAAGLERPQQRALGRGGVFYGVVVPGRRAEQEEPAVTGCEQLHGVLQLGMLSERGGGARRHAQAGAPARVGQLPFTRDVAGAIGRSSFLTVTRITSLRAVARWSDGG